MGTTQLETSPADLLTARMAGVFVPISTPFADDESVDFSALTFNVERYASSGVLGYLALGSNGENRSLTDVERPAANARQFHFASEYSPHSGFRHFDDARLCSLGRL